jgi:hypothetical protein
MPVPINLFLPVKRQMVAKFADDHLRWDAGTRILMTREVSEDTPEKQKRPGLAF